MINLLKFGAGILMATTVVSCSAESTKSNNEAQVQKFYDFLSNPGSNSHAKAFSAVTANKWESIGNYSGKNKNRDAFIGQMGGFSKLIPDLNWEVQSMHHDNDTVIVRSRATGTPNGPLFGVDGAGQGFDILTIDIHQMDGEKIVSTYHVEDWAGALQQLTTPEAAKAKAAQAEGEKTLATVMAFMGAMGKGDMDTMDKLMADDMVWHNEGDKRIPWIGPWKGKEEMFNFLGKFSAGAKTTLWENEDVIASGDTVGVFGRMKFVTTASGQETDEFTFALRAKVRDGKVVLWNWFENSYDVSQTFHGKE